MLAVFAPQGPNAVQSLAGTGVVNWATFGVYTNSDTGATNPHAIANMYAGSALSPMGRARPYRARGFGRRWNSKPVQPVPMATDITRVPIRQFNPRDLTAEPTIGE